jgi:hypothetical protein
MWFSGQIIYPPLLNVAMVFLSQDVELRHNFIILLLARKDELFEEFIIYCFILLGFYTKDTFDHERIVSHSKVEKV